MLLSEVTGGRTTLRNKVIVTKLFLVTLQLGQAKIHGTYTEGSWVGGCVQTSCIQGRWVMEKLERC